MNPLLDLFNKVLKDNPEIEATAKRVTEGLNTFGERMNAKVTNTAKKENMSNFIKKAPACASLAKTGKATDEHIRACIMEIIRWIGNQEKPKVDEKPDPLFEFFQTQVANRLEVGYTKEDIERTMLKFVSTETLRKGDRTP
jgi:hypothetical protein